MVSFLKRIGLRPVWLCATLCLLFFQQTTFAEGIKELAPASSDTLMLNCNNGAYYDFARYDGDSSTRLYIHIEHPNKEQVFLGFSQPRSSIYTNSPQVTGWFRIKAPDGTVVYTAQRIDGTTANINNWSQGNAGPAPIAGSGGYTPFVFDPTGLAAGDYYIEFNRDSSTYNTGVLTFEYFDITVATNGTTPAAINGRVFAYNWAFAAPSNRLNATTYGDYHRPFNGTFYVYTDEQYVSKIDFNGSGFQPWAFNISLNSTGTATGLGVVENRKSLQSMQGNIPEYAVYLNDPDASIYPSGTFGELLTDSTLLYGCPQSGYFFKLVTTKTGVVEVLLDQDQASGTGVYDPGTADRLLAFYVEQQLTDTIPGIYIRHIPWDGLDGLGNAVNLANPVPTKVTFSQGGYHIPVYDAEYNLNGFTATIERPSPPVGYSLGFYYDDSNISEAPTGSEVETVGCTPACHTWTDYDFGDLNTINTWWFAKQENQSVNMMVVADCGPDNDGDGTADAIDIDWDNDGLPNFMESCNLPFLDSIKVQLNIQMDNFPADFSWELRNASNAVVESGGSYTTANALETETFTVPNGTYNLVITDAFNDGICCTHGDGYFEVILNDVHTIGGSGNGSYGSGTTVTFNEFDYLYSCLEADPTIDSDNDNIPNYQDEDFCTLNSYGICSSLDSDNDGIPAFLDLDSDNDGIPDIVEAGGTDTNNDGQVDYATPGDPSTMADGDNDGLADAYDPDQPATSFIPNPDTDGDLVPDFFDLDSDDDGIADLVEVGGVDADGNGQVDSMTNPATGDANDDGWADDIAASPLVDQSLADADIDFDGDAYANHLDLDADADGIADVIESGGQDGNGNGMADNGAGTRTDANKDGWDDNYDNAVITVSADGPDAGTRLDYPSGGGAVDRDGDGLPNWLDIDADDDGLVDHNEAQATPTAGILFPSSGTDSDGDGMNDIFEQPATIGSFGGAGLSPTNTDGVAVDGSDYLDVDADNDLENDAIEGHDTDGDGNVDGSDSPAAGTGMATGTDVDNDGLDDGFDNNTSSKDPTNGNLEPESYVNFDDLSTNERDWRETTDIDLDNDGVTNAAEDGGTGFDPVGDADGDGTPNAFDDSDATSGFPTWTDSNNDGINDAYDADLDGVPDYADLDSDNDGIPDIVEAGGSDADGDGRADDLTDTDLDGLVDIYDGNCTNASCTPATTGTDLTPDDRDGDGLDDMYDLDSDNDGLADIIEVGGVDADGNGMADDMINPATGDLNSDGWSDAIDASPIVNTSLSDATIDFDGDAYPNHLDLDSDDDGITDVRESGGQDGNGDGLAEDGSLAGTRVDANNDGWEDNYDNGVMTSTADGSDANSLADFPTGTKQADQDGDGLPNWLDIDADNDGIVDNSESQLTSSTQYVAPLTGPSSDSDNDGLNDAYEQPGTIGSYGGVGIIPINTDGADNPDYLDVDSDNDLENDAIEGHDTDGNGVVNGSDAATANTGLATGTDSDQDGLDDGFDNNIGSREATDGGLDPESYANADDNSTNERDWRETTDIDLDNDGIPNIAEDGGTGFNPIADADGDGTPNFTDDNDVTPGFPTFVDSNNDGINDVFDMDLDGVPDYIDLDSDNDGIPDIVEAGGDDANGDGRADDLTDTDGDGLVDTYDGSCVGVGCSPSTTGTDLTAPDSDGDGLADPYDIDSDNDGIPDLIEAGGTDADKNGIVDNTVDADDDGLADIYDENANDGSGSGGTNGTALAETDGSGNWVSGTGNSLDSDGDGQADGIDLDSDSDGLPDIIEAGGNDSNNDGYVDYATPGDASTMADADNDGLVDTYDPDQNTAIANTDTDGDGTTDAYDLDSDNDGIADLVEVGGVDSDGNGRVDQMSNPSTGDTDNDGWADVMETTPLVDQNLTDNDIDFDGDSYPNHLDLDSDGDGITDVTESGGQDGNADGLADNGSSGGTRTDANADGWDDNYDGGVITAAADGPDANSRLDYPTGSGNPDFDGDGLPNWLDIDADDDGIVDNSEAQQTSNLRYVAPGADNDGDGLADAYETLATVGTFGGAGIDPVNTDGLGDGDDYLDANADNDAEQDVLEAHDTNGDGVVNGSDSPVANTGLATGADTDNDGLDDGFDNNIGSVDPTDGNLEPENYANADDASTNERDWREVNDIDIDDDGIPNSAEDGGTGFDPLADADGDGVPNFQDDNDTTTGFPTFVDRNNDGINDAYDADVDGIPDYYDLDADGDGIPDLVEARGVDTNGDGRVDDLTDTDGDGLANTYDGNCSGTGCSPATTGTDLSPPDTDLDGTPNYYDLDADNDGIPDLVEAGGIDTNGDGRVDDNTDGDEDGLADVYDENATDGNGVGGTNGVALVETNSSGVWQDGASGNVLDTDGDNLVDGLDLDADNDGIPDIREAGGVDFGGSGMVDTGLSPWDVDGDGFADVYDTNVGDGPGGTGANGTALVRTTADTDADGKVGAVGESMTAGGSNNINADGDGRANHIDLDSDNDGITDVVENAGGNTTADHSSGSLDGIFGDASAISDANTNGWHDSASSSTTDTDGDQIPDYLDVDADNDGIPDYLEGVCTLGCPIPSGGESDANDNGVLDLYEGLTASNGSSGGNVGVTPHADADDMVDAIPDYLDTDTDEDGAYDWTEGFDVDGDDGAADDLMQMASTFAGNNSGNAGVYINANDTDSDGLPDWLDNLNGAGYTTGTRPPFLTYGSSFWQDGNGNGLADVLDVAEGGTLAPLPDANGGDKDWRDITSAPSLPLELTYFVVEEKDCQLLLNWGSESEVVFSHFEIEHSVDGRNFELLETVSSSNKGGDDYQFVHQTESQSNYYRLKMVDLDAAYRYSDIAYGEQNCEQGQAKLSVFPNPVGERSILNLRHEGFTAGFQLTIVGQSGEIVRQLEVQDAKGQTVVPIDVSDLASGMYWINAYTADELISIKFVKM